MGIIHSLTYVLWFPQGSIPGPLLFLLYVNDLPNTYSLLKFHLFADDTNLFFFSRKSLGLLESALNQELKYITEWMKVNRLGLNVSKTNFILFHSCKLKLNQSFSVKIDIYLSLSTGIE